MFGRVPRITRWSKNFVEGVRTEPELGNVRLAEHDGARCFLALHNEGVRVGDVIAKDWRAIGSADAFRVDEVFHSNWQAMEWAATCRRAQQLRRLPLPRPSVGLPARA